MDISLSQQKSNQAHILQSKLLLFFAIPSVIYRQRENMAQT